MTPEKYDWMNLKNSLDRKRNSWRSCTCPTPWALSIPSYFAGVIDRGDAQNRAFLLAQHLPGDDIGVMLHGGDEDFVAGLDLAAAESRGHEVDALGRSADEDNFAPLVALQKPLLVHAPLFIFL